MLDQKEVTVNFSSGPKQYVIQQLPATRCMQVGIYMMQIVSGAAKGVGFTTSDRLEETPLNIAGIFSGMVDKLCVDASPAFIKRLVMESVITPKMVDDVFESSFSGELDALITLVEKIIEHNNLKEALKKRVEAITSNLLSDGKGAK
jgi:hypothetical protein